jgi:nucleotide-binding universal stress UspA family protein
MRSIADTPFTRTLAASAVATALVFSLGTGYAADAKKDAGAKPKPATEEQVPLAERETVAQYAGWEDPDMARIAVHGGRSLLRHTRAAHTDLEENKVGEARSALSAAEDFAEGLQLMVPYTVVVDNLRNAKNELLASSRGIIVDDLLPIYSSLDEMAEYAPELAAKAKAKLDEATQHVKKGEKGKAAEKLNEIAADISATTVYLPVLYVENQVEAARNALDQDPPDTKTAKSAVDNAMLSLVHTTVNMHVFPEEKAAGKAPPAAPKPETKTSG